MKITLLPFIIITMIYLNGCNLNEQNKNKSNCDSILKDIKLQSTIVDIYGIDTIFYNYLDTIIDYEPFKKYFNKCNSIFLFSSSLVESTENLGLDEILITTIDKYRYNYARCFGMFTYKGYGFICDSLCDKSLLKKINKKASIRYFALDKYLWQGDIDDRFSTWYFIKKNNRIIKTGHYYPLD